MGYLDLMGFELLWVWPYGRLAEIKANVNCRHYMKAAFVLNIAKMSGGEAFKLAMRPRVVA